MCGRERRGDAPAWEETHTWSCTKPGRRAIDLWIGEASDLGHGYGTQMMKLAIERCFADPSVDAVLVDPLDCNTRATTSTSALAGGRGAAPRPCGRCS